MGLFMKMKDYIVSDLRLRIEGPLADSFDDMLPSFKPFAVERGRVRISTQRGGVYPND